MKNLLLGLIFILSLVPLSNSQTPPSFSVLSAESYAFEDKNLDGLISELETAEYSESFDIFDISFKDSLFIHDTGALVQIYDIVKYQIVKYQYNSEKTTINFVVKSRKTGYTYSYDYFEHNNEGVFIIITGCDEDGSCSGLSYGIQNLRQLHD